MTTLAQARNLRRTPPATERLLWETLRDRRLEGLKFRRQVSIGPYIADFVCLKFKLNVEADGPFHDDEADKLRDHLLSQRGFRVLRFANGRIWSDRGRVLDEIVAATRLAALSSDQEANGDG